MENTLKSLEDNASPEAKLMIALTNISNDLTHLKEENRKIFQVAEETKAHMVNKELHRCAQQNDRLLNIEALVGAIENAESVKKAKKEGLIQGAGWIKWGVITLIAASGWISAHADAFIIILRALKSG